MTDHLTPEAVKAALDGATPGPWSLPHFAASDCNCDCRYVLAQYGGMGSIATISVCNRMEMPWGDDTGPDVPQAQANARLIAMAPDIARDWLRLKKVEGAGKEAFETETLTGGGSPEAWAKHVKALAAFRAAVEGK